MQFTEYDQAAEKFASFAKDTQEYKLMLLSMGLAGETGEVVDKLKKIINNEGGVLTEEKRTAIALELGDVLWYLSQLATTCGVSLDAVAKANIAKLTDRAARGVVVKGEGDTR